MRACFHMSRASTPQMRNVAKRLMAYETGGNKSSETQNPMAFHCCDKLLRRLTTLMGYAGYRALLSRALASSEVRMLHGVHVKADGSLEGLEDLHVQLAPGEFVEARVVLLAELLEWLVAFIGEDLTLHLVREVWPNIPINDLDFGKEGRYEQAN